MKFGNVMVDHGMINNTMAYLHLFCKWISNKNEHLIDEFER